MPRSTRPDPFRFRATKVGADTALTNIVRMVQDEIVQVEFTPQEPGEYEFTYQMGMMCGKLVVE